MELVAGLDTQIFVIFLGVVVALGCTLIAFLVDYLKGKNERLREQVLEMTVRQEERARHPQLQMDSTAVLSAIAQVGKNLELVVRSAVNHEAVAETPAMPAPVYQKRPSANERAEAKPPVPEPLVEERAPVIEPPVVVPAALSTEPDWHKATWHEAPIAQPAPELTVTQELAPEPLVPEPLVAEPLVAEPLAPAPIVEPEQHLVTTTPLRESLRSLFDSPSGVAEASRLELERRLDETIPEEPMAAVPVEDTPSATTDEPVVRIRVLNNGSASPLSEEGLAPVMEIATPILEVPEVAVSQEPAQEELGEAVYEELPVTAPVDFLTAADLGESIVSEPIESFDSLMAAVNAEPSVAPEPEAAEPQ